MWKTRNRWLIALSAVCIHISIGSVYAWSVFTKPIGAFTGWSFKEIQFTFSIAILFLGVSAAFMGHYVESKGPRKSGTLSSIFFGLGLIGSGYAIQVKSIYILYLCYGVIGGIGLGIGYIAPVSTLVKWFPDKRGFATGLAIMGFGFAALLAGPVIQQLILTTGIAGTFYIIGIIYFLLMLASSQYLAPPPKGWYPGAYKDPLLNNADDQKKRLLQMTANEAAGTPRFYMIWIMLFINITCGIALISVASPMGQEYCAMSTFQAAVMVGLIGLFNGGGRIFWAALSDYTGRPNVYTILFAIELIAMFFLPTISNPVIFQIVLFIVMTCYGGGFACIPAYIGDIFGTRQLGAIHGYILTAWACAGIIAPNATAWIHEKTGSYSQTMAIFMVLFIAALLISLLIRIDIRKALKSLETTEETASGPAAESNEKSFNAEISELRSMTDYVCLRARNENIPETRIFDICLAVEEAALNICMFAYMEEKAVNMAGYAYGCHGKYKVKIEKSRELFRVSLIDSGKAFNPLTVMPPDLNASIKERDHGGLGIHLIKNIADEFSYTRSNEFNIITLGFRI